MTRKSFLKKYLSKVQMLEEDGMMGEKYLGELSDGTSVFVKTRSKSESNWFIWGLRKEYIVSQVLSEKTDTVPEPVLLFENQDFLAVGFKNKKSSVSYWDLFENRRLLEKIISQYTELLVTLGDISRSSPYLISSLKNKEQARRGGFSDTKTYMFNDRLVDGVYFSDEYKDEYDNLLEKSVRRAKSSYEEDREVLVHGDIQNPNNSLFVESGLNAVVDWEISGWFDYLYDIAFIESMFVDKPCAYSSELERSTLLDILYRPYDINRKNIQSIKCYKCWPHYLELESLHMSSEIDNDSIDIEEERKRQKRILENLEKDIL